MIDRRLAADLGLAALIAIPAALPAAPTPRPVNSHVAATAHAPVVANRGLDRGTAAAIHVQGRS
jgi:hypothetical protein